MKKSIFYISCGIIFTFIISSCSTHRNFSYYDGIYENPQEKNNTADQSYYAPIDIPNTDEFYDRFYSAQDSINPNNFSANEYNNQAPVEVTNVYINQDPFYNNWNGWGWNNAWYGGWGAGAYWGWNRWNTNPWGWNSRFYDPFWGVNNFYYSPRVYNNRRIFNSRVRNNRRYNPYSNRQYRGNNRNYNNTRTRTSTRSYNYNNNNNTSTNNRQSSYKRSSTNTNNKTYSRSSSSRSSSKKTNSRTKSRRR